MKKTKRLLALSLVLVMLLTLMPMAALADAAGTGLDSKITVTINGVPEVVIMGETYDCVSATLKAANGAGTYYQKARFKISVSGPEDSTPVIEATDSDGVIWNLPEIGYWGPEKGFPIEAGYEATTALKVRFDKAGDYTVTFRLVDLDNDEAVIAEGSSKIHVHNVVVDEAVAATCTEAGKTAGSHCSVCNAVIKAQEEIPAKGHDYGELENVKEATCTEAGYTGDKTCKSCGEIARGETIEAKGHNYENGKCSVCGATEYTVTINDVPESIVPGKTYEGVSATLKAVSGATSYSSARFIIEVTGPEGSKPQILATDSKDKEFNLAETKAWGPATGFPINDKYDVTTPLKVCFDKGGDYKVTFRLVDTANDNAVIAEGSKEIHVHTVDVDAAVAATCTVAGKTAGSHCSVCNAVIEEQKEIPAKGHDYGELVNAKKATCTEAGYTGDKTCKSCGEIAYGETIEATGHNYENGKCSVCGVDAYAIAINNVPKSIVPGETYEGVSATLKAAAGAKSYSSARFIIEVTGPEGSKPQILATDSKDTEFNLAEIKAWGPATGFPINDKYDVTTPLKVCFDVGGEYTVTFRLVDVANNNAVIAEGSSKIHVHTVDVDAAVAATCTEAGKTEGSHCSVCEAVIKAQETIPAKGHTAVTDAAVAATCTEAGKTEGSHCSVCEAVIKAQETIPAKGHTAVTDAAVAATCTEAGKTEGSHCSVCKAVIKAQETIPAKGHTAVTDAAVAATCTEAGKTEGSHCSVCNAVIKAQETIPAKGHTAVTDAAVAATCTEAGKTEGSHCSVCNAVIKAQETVPAKGHTAVTDAAVAATCTETGLTEGSHCSVCKEILKAQTATKALGHDYKNGICTRCKAVDPNYVENPFKDVKKGDPFYADIIWAANEGIVKGDEKGNYNADSNLTRAEVVTMLWRMAGEKKAAKAADFTDLNQPWYMEAVAWAVENGITEGVGNNKFDPDGACTRAQFVTFLWRANGKLAPTATVVFTDLTQDWYKDAVAWAASIGVTNGVGDNKFDPDSNCTRGQAAAFLHRLAESAK